MKNRIICCNSTNPLTPYEKIYQCDGCKNLWHGQCYNHYQGCCKDYGTKLIAENENAWLLGREDA